MSEIDQRPVQGGIDFLGLRQDGSAQWHLPVSLAICSGTGRLFGGAASAALASAIETTCARSIKVLHVQFLRGAKRGVQLTGAVTHAPGGRVAYAGLTLLDESRPVLRATAVLGAPEGAVRFDRPAPVVPDPQDCPSRGYDFPLAGSLNDRLTVRVAGFAEGRLPRATLWIRSPWGPDLSAASLALVADHVPFALLHAPGSPFEEPVVTVDSTLRVIQPPRASGWLLVDVRVDAIGDRFAVGTAEVWTEDLQLVAIGTQTMTKVGP